MLDIHIELENEERLAGNIGLCEYDAAKVYANPSSNLLF